MSASRLRRLVDAAAAGDQNAWQALVTRFNPMIRSIARRHRLSAADQDDVMQRTWLALVRYIRRLSTPEALPAWLATTARNESLATLRGSLREFPVDEVPPARDSREGSDHVVEEVLSEARRTALREAVARVGGRERAMLEMLLDQAGPSYAEISAKLGMPVGSIGPTRARSLMRLRRDPQIAGLLDDSIRPLRPTRPTRHDAGDVL
jgi:RNA polymerase sigma factor (sigma-70 family)